MIKSSLRRAFAMLRLAILVGIASLGAFAMPSAFKFVPSALAVTATEKPLRANPLAGKSQHAVPGDNDEAMPSSEVDDEDDGSSGEDCDDDNEDD
jgi:hypothetical protein